MLSNNESLKQLEKEIQERYIKIIEPCQIEELQNIQDEMTFILKTFVPNAGVQLLWDTDNEIELPLPSANVKLEEDGFHSSVTRSGHGLQRAFIMTMLQLLAVLQYQQDIEEIDNEYGDTIVEEKSRLSERYFNLIIGIEEPELYQHPNRQRNIANIFIKLAKGILPGVAKKTQIIYSTHSPLFVGMDRFDQIRLLRKISGDPGKPKITTNKQSSLKLVAELIAKLKGETEFSANTLRTKLHTLMTPWMNEGFFSDAVVLVEGEKDRAAIIAIADVLKINLEGKGISVIPTMGKGNLDKDYLVFNALSIPTYVIWDSDKNKGNNKDVQKNRYLLRIFNREEEDWPEAVTDEYACFRDNLDLKIKAGIEPKYYDELIDRAMKEHEIQHKDNVKVSPVIMTEILKKANRERGMPEMLRTIIIRITQKLEKKEE